MQITLDDAELQMVIGALDVAREKYYEIYETLSDQVKTAPAQAQTGMKRLADQFMRQSEQAKALAEKLEF